MKKLISILLSVLILTAVFINPVFAEDSTESSEFTPFFAFEKPSNVTIEIDGVMEAAYITAPVININKTKSTQSTTTGKAWILWDKEYFYVYIEVADSNQISEVAATDFYKTDSVEFTFNLDYPLVGSSDNLNAGQYTASPCDNANNQWQGLGAHFELNKANAVYVHKVDTERNTYIIEMKIPFGEDFMPVKGCSIGFCMHINDARKQAQSRFANIFTGDPTTQGNAHKNTEFQDVLVLTDSSLLINPLPPVDLPDDGGSDTDTDTETESATEVPTEAPTDAPIETSLNEQTKAPDTQNDTTKTTNETPAADSGCGGSIRPTVIIGILMLIAAVVTIGLKRRKC